MQNKPHIEGSESTQSPVEQRKGLVSYSRYMAQESLISELGAAVLDDKGLQERGMISPQEEQSERGSATLTYRSEFFTKNLDTDIDNTRTMPEQPNPEQSYDPISSEFAG